MDQALLSDVIERIEEIYKYLYQDNADAAYSRVAGMVGKLEQVIVQIDDDSVQGEMKEQLLAALNAMEEGDNVLLADIFQYEINERLLQYKED